MAACSVGPCWSACWKEGWVRGVEAGLAPRGTALSSWLTPGPHFPSIPPLLPQVFRFPWYDRFQQWVEPLLLQVKVAGEAAEPKGAGRTCGAVRVQRWGAGQPASPAQCQPHPSPLQIHSTRAAVSRLQTRWAQLVWATGCARIEACLIICSISVCNAGPGRSGFGQCDAPAAGPHGTPLGHPEPHRHGWLCICRAPHPLGAAVEPGWVGWVGSRLWAGSARRAGRDIAPRKGGEEAPQVRPPPPGRCITSAPVSS